MKLPQFAYSVLFVSATSLNALAATTADDAAKLKAALQPYLGQASDVVVIEPSGDAFNVKLDIASTLATLNKDGANFSLSPIAFKVAPLGNGKWKVDIDSTFNLSATVPNQLTLTETIESLKLTGVFDEALGYFESLDVTSGPFSFVEEIVDADKSAIKISGRLSGFTQKDTGKANPAGGIDLTAIGKFASMEFDVAGGAEMPPIKFIAGQTDYNVTASGLKMRELLNLWKFAVANIKSAKIEDPVAFKALLTAALPLLGNLTETVTMNKIAVQTPMGNGGADKFGINIGFNGVVKDGMFQEGISVEGLSLPEALVPPFATGLVPKNFGFDFKIAGFDLATAANAWLAAADFSKTPPVSPEVEATLAPMMMPKTGVEITIQDTGLNNSTYAFTVDGKSTTDFAAMPAVKGVITGKGLDELLKLVLALPPEMGAQGAGGVITMAKGLGKAGADGKLVWDIEATPDGKVLVNGNDMSAMFGIPPQQ